MKLVLSLAMLLIAMLALVGGTALLGLIFRNPSRPDWLRRGWADSAAAVAIAAGFSGVIGYGMTSLIGLGLDVPAAIVLALVLLFGVGVAIDRLFHVRERLRLADAGRSPFVRLEPELAGPLSARKHPAV